MSKFQNKYRIESTRLNGWDYSSDGHYFITICTKNRECYFGEITKSEMKYSKSGEIANQYWSSIPDHFSNVELDAFQIMPNHIHGIIIIKNENNNNDCRDEAVPRLYGINKIDKINEIDKINKINEINEINQIDKTNKINKINNRPIYDGSYPEMSAISPKPKSLPVIIGSYKSIVKKMINRNYPVMGFRWQPGFHDHIIRNENELNRIRKYIRENPMKWEMDKNNIDNLWM